MAATAAPGPRWVFESGVTFEVLVRDEDGELVSVTASNYRGWQRTGDGIVHAFGSGAVAGRRAGRRQIPDGRIVRVEVSR